MRNISIRYVQDLVPVPPSLLTLTSYEDPVVGAELVFSADALLPQRTHQAKETRLWLCWNFGTAATKKRFFKLCWHCSRHKMPEQCDAEPFSPSCLLADNYKCTLLIAEHQTELVKLLLPAFGNLLKVDRFKGLTTSRHRPISKLSILEDRGVTITIQWVSLPIVQIWF